MSRMFATMLGLILLAQVCWAQEQTSTKDQKVRDSYSLGYEFGNNIKRQGVEIDLNVLLSAVQEGLENKNPTLSPQEITETLKELRKKLMIA